MKKAKLLIMFVLGVLLSQTAFAQTANFVDPREAIIRLMDKSSIFQKDMDAARQNSQEASYYLSKSKFHYYEEVIVSVKKFKNVSDAYNLTPYKSYSHDYDPSFDASAPDRIAAKTAKDNEDLVKKELLALLTN